MSDLLYIVMAPHGLIAGNPGIGGQGSEFHQFGNPKKVRQALNIITPKNAWQFEQEPQYYGSQLYQQNQFGNGQPSYQPQYARNPAPGGWQQGGHQ